MKFKKLSATAAVVAVTFILSACVEDGDMGATGAQGEQGVAGAQGVAGTNGVSNYVTIEDVVTTNANIAYAVYSDSVISAKHLRTALEALIDNPTDATFADAKSAWLASREPYGQSEVYRFRNGPIDALKGDGTMGTEGDGPEGAINAWPLGEALIDYTVSVDGDQNPEDVNKGLAVNIVANEADYPTLNKATILSLAEFGGDERNVATGYHAVEFLLWGQDLNDDMSGAGARDGSAGQRKVSDFYSTSNGNAGMCTSGVIAAADVICDRRGQYLLAATDILIDDLQAIATAWAPESGVHYKTFVAGGEESLATILEGMGRLSFGELGGERMNIALVTNSQEDEHSCFSDNTHRDIYLNAKGVQNTYHGTYTRIDGEVLTGASIEDLMVVGGHQELANTLRADLEATMASATVLDTLAKTGRPFDTLIDEGTEQENVVAVINNLVTQTETIETAISELGLTTGDIYQDTDQPIRD